MGWDTLHIKGKLIVSLLTCCRAWEVHVHCNLTRQNALHLIFLYWSRLHLK